MCYYNGQKIPATIPIRLKQLEKSLSDYDFFNRDLNIGFDYGLNAVLKPIPGIEDFEIVEMEWGFIPHYLHSREDIEHFRKGGINLKTGKYGPPVITLNAVGEELFQKVTFKEAAMKRRCLIPSSGFYEWRHFFPVSRKTGQPLKKAVKYPYFISLPEKEYFFMAGLWTPWADKNTGEYTESFTIVTTQANDLMAQIHNSKKRMPVILNRYLAYEWMFGKIDEKRVTDIATTQYPSNKMKAYPIVKDFISAPNPQEAFEYDDLPGLEPV